MALDSYAYWLTVFQVPAYSICFAVAGAIVLRFALGLMMGVFRGAD